MSEQWKTLADKEKKKYEAQAEKAKDAYKVAKAAYVSINSKCSTSHTSLLTLLSNEQDKKSAGAKKEEAPKEEEEEEEEEEEADD